ncbi:GGDEF domain-containing protein [Actinoplanes sp. Pm04-4]|uniref:GGDEF domain-containing protein n=1 Tax=Paractinoplanes pyxinae TaxID=2997416 RepID=A0ABT4BDL2_9ACTN|nr:GGDEF domain-containing protein [Actinoplanes pyxinae]MCY1143685.1 GGDEF domain-containing protein [Actinoplanes pyxinae]
MAATPSLIFIGEAFLGSRPLEPVRTTAGVVLAVVCAMLIVAPGRRAEPLLRLAAVIVGCVSIVMLDLGSGNASVTGQMYFCLPVLFVAVHFRVPGVIALTATALVCEALVVTLLLPPLDALLDFAFVGSILVLMAGALTRAGAAQDRLTAQLRRQAEVDPLTGLVTRRVFDEAAQRAVTGGAGFGTALILIDVDLFKQINDTYGHAVGDDALAHIAATLTECCRDADVVARLGGDELAVLMPGCTFGTAADRAAELAAAVRDAPLVLADGRVVPLSISAGAAHASPRSQTARDLYNDADMALYAAKRSRPAARR